MELELIKSNIEQALNINLNITTREQSLVDGRVIFCLLSLANGPLKYTPLTNVLKKNHSCICHYKSLATNLIKYNNTFKEKYIKCLEYIGKTELEIKYFLSNEFLEKATKKQERKQKAKKL